MGKCEAGNPVTIPAGIPCTWCKSTAPSHQIHGCGRLHCPFKPKTDTFQNKITSSQLDDEDCYVLAIDHARQLERELSGARTAAEVFKEELGKSQRELAEALDELETLEEGAITMEDVAKAIAEDRAARSSFAPDSAPHEEKK